jgi:hypothetical protein
MATRFDQTLADEEAVALDGDAGFVGVNARLSPEQVPSAYCAFAENIEFADGAAMSRRGVSAARWLRPGGPLWGAAQARHPVTREEGIILAASSGMWWCVDGNPPQLIATPEAPTKRVRFAQEFDRIVAYRWQLAPWVWDGIGGFELLDRTDREDGTRPIPLADHAEVLNDRVLVPADASNLDIGDIGELGAFGILNRVRCDTGRGDSVTRVFPFTQDSALVFKTRSVFLVSGIVGNLSGLRVDVVNAELGCIASESVASTGGDVLFLSQMGVFRVTQIVQDRIETAARAVSYDIEPLLRARVNWRAAYKAQGAVWGERYYLAVPIDGATRCNAMFVFNLSTNTWEGIHTYSFPLDVLLLADLAGNRRLFACDFSLGCCYTLLDGEEDIIDGEAFNVRAELHTRGYLAGSGTRKRFALAQVATSEWHSQWSVAMKTDGNGESQPLYPSNNTRSRTAPVAGLATWDATNAGNDHGQSGRADYTVILNPPLVLGTGIVLNRTQEFTERYQAQETGRWAQLQIVCTRGTLAVRGVQIEGAATDRALVPTS